MAKAHLAGDDINAEIVSEGIQVMLGYNHLSWKTLNAFIDHVVVSLDEIGGAMKRWTINESGLLVAKKPELSDKLWLMLRQGKPFTNTGDDFVELPDPTSKRKRKR